MRDKDIKQAIVHLLHDNLYRNPVTFVTECLGNYLPKWPDGTQRPSEPQRKMLEYASNLSNDRMIISAPRGAGKTLSLAMLATWSISEIPKMIDQEYKVCVLGGKYAQAKILHKYCSNWFWNIPYLNEKLDKVIEREINLKDGSQITTLAASERSVHGPHPDCLILDEACDADTKIIETATQMVVDSEYERIVFTSTPHKYFSKFVEVWHDARSLGYKRFHYKYDETPWLTEEKYERAKKEKDEELFKAEFDGLPAEKSDIVFPSKILRPNVKEERLKFKEGLYTSLGIDWGMGPSPTALVVCQRDGQEWRVIYIEELSKKTPESIAGRIRELYENYRVDQVFSNAENKSEIMRLREDGIPVRSVSFGYKRESEMIPRTRNLLKKKRLKFSAKEHDPLLKQMTQMIYKTTSSGKVTTKKKGTDLVDALMLALTSQEVETSGFGIETGRYDT